MLFVGCYTAIHDETSLPFAAVARGADAAVGFSDSIDCEVANSWTINFIYNYVELGRSLEDSCSRAALVCLNSGGIDSYVIVGE